MNFLELCQSRHSVRGYLPDPVPAEKLEYILECARLAPSAANRQPWRLHIVGGAEKEGLLAAYHRPWFAEAPLAVVFTGLQDTNWVRSDGANYLMGDVAIICDHFTLAAADAGLGTCWIGAFAEEAVRTALHLAPHEVPYFITPLGFPKEGSTRPKVRKALHEIVVYGASLHRHLLGSLTAHQPEHQSRHNDREKE